MQVGLPKFPEDRIEGQRVTVSQRSLISLIGVAVGLAIFIIGHYFFIKH